MKVKFSAILSISAAIEAAKENGDSLQYVPESVMSAHPEICIEAAKEDGDSLQYVLIKDLFVSIAAKLGIEVEF